MAGGGGERDLSLLRKSTYGSVAQIAYAAVELSRSSDEDRDVAVCRGVERGAICRRRARIGVMLLIVRRRRRWDSSKSFGWVSVSFISGIRRQVNHETWSGHERRMRFGRRRYGSVPARHFCRSDACSIINYEKQKREAVGHLFFFFFFFLLLTFLVLFFFSFISKVSITINYEL